MSTYSRNGATVTVTQASSWTATEKVLSTDQINSGFQTNIDSLSFAGSIRRGKPSVIAKVVIEADSGKYFSSPPRLKDKSKKLSLRLRDKVNQRLTVGDGVYFTSYTYDLILSSRSRTSTANSGLNASIVYTTKTIPTVETKIHDIVFGNKNILAGGETRDIRVYGEKGATFGLAINESLESRITVGDEEVKKYNKTEDESILRGSYNKTKYNYGKSMNIIRGKIPSTGVYSFDQVFPSTIISQTETTAAFSSTTKLTFKNLSGVRVGDRFYYPGLDANTVIKVSVLDPDGDNENECTLDTSVTVAKSKKCRFERNRTYTIDVIPDLTSTLGSKIPTTDPEYRLFQYQNPTLKITHRQSTGDLTIVEYNDTATSLGLGASHSISYTGVANKIYDKTPSDVKHRFSVKLKVTAAAGNFTSVVQPVFSNKTRKIYPRRATNAKGDYTANDNPVVSNWTNSISKSNGGTVVNITGIRVSATGSSTIYLYYDVEIFRWGDKNVDMGITLDDHLINT